MEKIQRRKEISDFAKKLRELANAAPDGYARRDLNRMIYSIRRRYILTPEQKQNIILKLIESGLTSYKELLDASKFTDRQLSKNLNQLISDKKIRLEKIKRNSGAGRPQPAYFLI